MGKITSESLEDYVKQRMKDNNIVFISDTFIQDNMEEWCRSRGWVFRVKAGTSMIRKMPLFVLMDGSNMVHRSFHAMYKQDLKTSNGFPTGAIFAFKNMLLHSILNQLEPYYALAVFDGKGDTFRHRMYPAYKEGRKSYPELKKQWTGCYDLVDAFGFERFIADGVEADDVIASVVYKFHGDVKFLIISNDKDLHQLASGSTCLYDTKKRRELTPDWVRAKFDIPHQSQISDYLALMGDTSDNIPGVDKIGPKSASVLLKQFHSVFGIIRNVKKIKSDPIRGKIEKSLDALRLSYSLTRLRHDVPPSGDLANFRVSPRNHADLKSIFEKYELSEEE